MLPDMNKKSTSQKHINSNDPTHHWFPKKDSSTTSITNIQNIEVYFNPIVVFKNADNNRTHTTSPP